MLQSPGRVEKEDIIAKIVKLSKHVDELKVEVHDTLQRNYVEFYPSLSSALELKARVEKTSEEMQQVADRLEKEVSSNNHGYNSFRCYNYAPVLHVAQYYLLRPCTPSMTLSKCCILPL